MKNSIFNKIVCASMLLCMVSCDDAKDLLQVSSNIPMPLSTGTCEDAKYLADARAWDVNSYGTPFENVGRIELTASGNYMFLPDMSSMVFEDLEDGEFYAPRLETNSRASDVIPGKNLVSPFRKAGKEAVGTTRAYGESYPAGTFTKTSDNVYVLSNLGRLIVNSDGTLTLENETGSYDFTATSVAPYELDALTRRFSRTWVVVEVERASYDPDGKLKKKRKLSQAEIEEDYVRAVVATQYGAFVRYDWDRQLDGWGLWKWEIPEKQFFQFVFTDGDYYGDSGFEQVYFYDDFAMFLEYGEESESGEYFETVDVLKTKSVTDLEL